MSMNDRYIDVLIICLIVFVLSSSSSKLELIDLLICVGCAADQLDDQVGFSKSTINQKFKAVISAINTSFRSDYLDIIPEDILEESWSLTEAAVLLVASGRLIVVTCHGSAQSDSNQYARERRVIQRL